MKTLIEQPICITRADGRVSVMQIITQAPLKCFAPADAIANGFVLNEAGDTWVGGITDWGVENEIARTFPGEKVQGWRRMTTDEVADYFAAGEFRGAHTDDGGKLAIDMDKARGIVRAQVRAARGARFEHLDNAMKPLEAKALIGSLTAAEKLAVSGIEAQRQALRDAPANPAIDAAKTIEDLKAHLEAFGG